MDFENVYRLLKPNGILVFSAPYSKDGETVEHFPELNDYQLQKSNGEYVLRNVTKNGVAQVFENLVFHGGKARAGDDHRFCPPAKLVHDVEPEVLDDD